MNEYIIKEHFIEDTAKLIENELLLAARQWKIIKCEFPELIISATHHSSKKEYLIKFLCDSYPVDVSVIEPNSMQMAPFEQWPRGGLFLNPNSETQKPFICMPNIRDYYKHHKEVVYSYNHDTRIKWVIDLVYSLLLQTQQ